MRIAGQASATCTILLRSFNGRRKLAPISRRSMTEQDLEKYGSSSTYYCPASSEAPFSSSRQSVQPTALRRGGKKPARRCLFGRCGTVPSGAAITVSAPSADFDAPRKGLFDLLRRRSGRSAQAIAVTQAGLNERSRRRSAARTCGRMTGAAEGLAARRARSLA